jgi:hypothetical protein
MQFVQNKQVPTLYAVSELVSASLFYPLSLPLSMTVSILAAPIQTQPLKALRRQATASAAATSRVPRAAQIQQHK